METTAQSNREFYNKVSGIYEVADGKRKRPNKELVKNLKNLRFVGGRLLDLGAGTGYLSKIAVDIYEAVYACDISYEMLDKIDDLRIRTSLADITDKIPYPDNYFDVVCAYAVFHHLNNFNKTLSEIKRVLKPGGVFYIDEDITKEFYDKFKILVDTWRFIQRPHIRYGVDKDEFSKVEIHSKGIDAEKIQKILRQYGFRLHVVRRAPVLTMFAAKGGL